MKTGVDLPKTCQDVAVVVLNPTNNVTRINTEAIPFTDEGLEY